MTPEIITGLIAASVALVTSIITGLLTWIALKREKTKWLTGLKSSLTHERYKKRLETYPQASEIISRMSKQALQPFTPEIANSIGHDLNKWWYSTGGLCADQSTRGAILGLRDSCLNWKEGPTPKEIWQWRDAVYFNLRRDLDLVGLDKYDPKDTLPLLEKLLEEMKTIRS